MSRRFFCPDGGGVGEEAAGRRQSQTAAEGGVQVKDSPDEPGFGAFGPFRSGGPTLQTSHTPAGGAARRDTERRRGGKQDTSKLMKTHN